LATELDRDTARWCTGIIDSLLELRCSLTQCDAVEVGREAFGWLESSASTAIGSVLELFIHCSIHWRNPNCSKAITKSTKAKSAGITKSLLMDGVSSRKRSFSWWSWWARSSQKGKWSS